MKLTLFGIALVVTAIYFIYELLKASKDEPMRKRTEVDAWRKLDEHEKSLGE
jgi:hypothetical protein